MSKNDDALRCAEALRQLDGAKKYHPTGPGGQMCGSESYRLVASGFSFYELQNAADHLDRLVAENEAQVALLRQALEALIENCSGNTHGKAIDAILRRLEGK